MSSETDSSSWVFYAYQPNGALAIATAAIFAALFVVHAFLTTRYKLWRCMWAFNLAIPMEVAGYALRRVSADQPNGKDGLKWYISQNLCIILAPALLAASMYMVFGRLVRYVDDSISPIRSTRITRIFVSFDFLSFVVQGAGGSLYSSDNRSLYNVAKGILIAGFLIQIIAFGIFVVFATIYHRRALKVGVPGRKWQALLYTLYIGAALILLRSCFRTAEFAQGNALNSSLQAHEAYYYGLEALPILLCVILFIFSHPGRYIPSDPRVRLQDLSSDTPSGMGEGEKPAGEESRRWWSKSKS